MRKIEKLFILCFSVFALAAATGCVAATEDDEIWLEDAEVGTKEQALSGGCALGIAVPLRGPNVSNRLGSNACTSIIPPFLPSWWQYGDGLARVQIADFDDQDSESAFPLTVEWENTCGTEQGTVTFTQPWQQHELGHPSAECSIVIKLGGVSTEDVLIFWGA